MSGEVLKYKFTSNCISVDKTTMRVKFTENPINESIVITAAYAVPYIILTVPEFYSENRFYPICGPLIMLMKELARLKNMWLQFVKVPESSTEMFEYLTEGVLDFAVICVDASLYVNYKPEVESSGLHLYPTRVIDYIDDAFIAHRKEPGAKEIFVYFKLFPYEVYSFTLLSLIIVSLLLSWYNLTVKKFLNNLFVTTTSLFIVQLPGKLNTLPLSYRILFVTWLIACYFISMLFTSGILDEKVKATPEIKIDNWDDLYNTKGLKFIAIENSLMDEFINTDSPMAKNFGKRIIKISIDDWENPMLWTDWAEQLYSGKIALVMNKYRLVFRIGDFARIIEDTHDINGQQFIENLHVSREGGSSLPFFIISMLEPNHKHYKSLDHLIIRTTETGFYDKWKQRSLKENGYYTKFDEYILEAPCNYEPITMNNTFEVSSILLLGIILSILIFFHEIQSHK